MRKDRGGTVKRLVLLAKNTRGGLNVNIPVDREIAGERLRKLARSEHRSQYERLQDGTYRRKWAEPKNQTEKDCDEYLILQGYITLSPLSADMNDYGYWAKRGSM